MNLESASQSLLEQFPSGQSEDLYLRERSLERFGRIASVGFGGVLIVAVLAVLYTIFTRMVVTGQQPLAGLLLIAFIVFAVLTLGYVFFNEDLKERRKQKAPVEPRELDLPIATGRLIEEREFEPIPTVTERTTDLLPTKARER